MKFRLNKTTISDTITKTIQSSLPNTVSITDAVGVEITRSRNAIVTNTCILIVLKNTYTDGSSQRWLSPTPFALV